MEAKTGTIHGGRISSPERRGGSRAKSASRAAEPSRGTLEIVRDYIILTKPRIISLLLLTTVTTMFVADPSGPALSTILWTMLGGYLAAGGAGAINHYLERESDARMARTSGRPIASGRIDPSHGLAFGIALGALATAQLGLTVNALSAVLAAGGLLGYIFVYTLWLKPRTPLNIVLGGAAGAMPPLVGWAAATGSLSTEALWPFAIIFFWTPPHFWALSLLIADDYARTGVPMLPVVRGEGDDPAPDRRLLAAARRDHRRARDHRALRRVLPRRGAGPGRRVHRARDLACPPPLPPRGPPPLPELARLPGDPVRGDGRRQGGLGPL